MITRKRVKDCRDVMDQFIQMLNEVENEFDGLDDESTINNYELSNKLRTKSHDLTKALTKFRQIRMGQVDNQHRLKPYFKKFPDAGMVIHEENIKKFFKHMFERQEIWYKRNILKENPPYTKDVILRDYKFTNVYRDLDRSSQFLIRNVLCDPKNENSIEDIIFKIIIYRLVNNPDSFVDKKYPVELQNWKNFDAEKMWEQAVTYRENVGNMWQISYMTNMAFLPMPDNWKGRGLFKDHAYIRHVFPKVHEIIPELKNLMKIAKSVKEILDFIEKNIPGVASFISHEFFLDFIAVGRYWRQPIIKFKEDDFCNVGPGASLGIRLLFPSLQTIKEQEEAMIWLRDISEEELAEYGDFKYIEWDKKMREYKLTDKWNLNLHTAAEFTLCEFSKRWKMEIGEGKQRSKFIQNNNNWNL